MEKRTLIIILISLFIGNAVIAYHLSDSISDRNNKVLLSQNTNQIDEIVNNNHLVLQLLDAVTALKKQNVSMIYKDSALGKEFDNEGMKENFKKIDAELKFLKKEISDLSLETVASLQELSIATNTHSLTNNIVNNQTNVQEYPREFVQQENDNVDTAFEIILQEASEDVNWTSEYQEKVGNLISADKLGKDVELQNVDCRTSFCKISFAHAEGGTVNDFELYASLGEVNTYTTQKNSGIAGQQMTVMYISRSGEELPSIDEVR